MKDVEANLLENPVFADFAADRAAKRPGAACASPFLLALMLNSYNTVWTDLTIRL
jgi:hypothetical protein